MCIFTKSLIGKNLNKINFRKSKEINLELIKTRGIDYFYEKLSNSLYDKEKKYIVFHFHSKFYHHFYEIQKRIDKLVQSAVFVKRFFLIVHKSNRYSGQAKEPSLITDKSWKYYFIEQFSNTAECLNYKNMRFNLKLFSKSSNHILKKIINTRFEEIFEKALKKSIDWMRHYQVNVAQKIETNFKDEKDSIQTQLSLYAYLKDLMILFLKKDFFELDWKVDYCFSNSHHKSEKTVEGYFMKFIFLKSVEHLKQIWQVLASSSAIHSFAYFYQIDNKFDTVKQFYFTKIKDYITKHFKQKNSQKQKFTFLNQQNGVRKLLIPFISSDFVKLNDLSLLNKIRQTKALIEVKY